MDTLDTIRSRIKELWVQCSHWARPGRGGAYWYRVTMDLLAAGGYRRLGPGPVPAGVEIIYAPTGTIDPGGRGRKTRYYIGRWYRPTSSSSNNDAA